MSDRNVQVALLRRANFAACGVTAGIVGWLATSPPWLGATFAAWSALLGLALVAATYLKLDRGERP